MSDRLSLAVGRRGDMGARGGGGWVRWRDGGVGAGGGKGARCALMCVAIRVMSEAYHCDIVAFGDAR